MYCGNCGSFNNDINVFCEKCGSKLMQAQDMSGTVNPTMPVNDMVPVNVKSVRKKKRNKSFKILMVLLVFSFLFFATALTLFLVTNKKNGSKSSDADKIDKYISEHRYNDAYTLIEGSDGLSDAQKNKYYNEVYYSSYCVSEMDKIEGKIEAQEGYELDSITWSTEDCSDDTFTLHGDADHPAMDFVYKNKDDKERHVSLEFDGNEYVVVNDGDSGIIAEISDDEDGNLSNGMVSDIPEYKKDIESGKVEKVEAPVGKRIETGDDGTSEVEAGDEEIDEVEDLSSVSENMSELLCDGDPQNVRYVYSSELSEDWKRCYIEKVSEEFSNKNIVASSEAPYSYTIDDMDKDGIPELFIKYGDCEAAYHFILYRYNNGNVEQVESGGFGHSSLYSIPGKGFLTYWAHMGGYSITKANYDGGSVTYEELNAGGEEYQYPDAEDYEPGAVALTFYSLDNDFPIISYNVNISTKSDKSNDEARQILEDTYNNDGSVMMTFCDWDSVTEYENQKISSICSCGVFSGYNCSFGDTLWGDLNGDGQDEYIIIINSDGKPYFSLVLSYQNDYVYAYCTYTSGDSIEIKDGKIVSYNSSYWSDYKFTFFKNKMYYQSYFHE